MMNQLAQNRTNNDECPLHKKLYLLKTTLTRHSQYCRQQMYTESCINMFFDATCANSLVFSLFF